MNPCCHDTDDAMHTTAYTDMTAATLVTVIANTTSLTSLASLTAIAIIATIAIIAATNCDVGLDENLLEQLHVDINRSPDCPPPLPILVPTIFTLDDPHNAVANHEPITLLQCLQQRQKHRHIFHRTSQYRHIRHYLCGRMGG